MILRGEGFTLRTILLGLMLTLSACTTVREFETPDYSLPADRPVTILVMRPDVEVSSVTTGGVPQPNADWTEQARTSLMTALEDDQRTRGNRIAVLPEQSGEGARLVADYEALHRSVADQIARFKYSGIVLPTKRGQFDWTLGPGASRIGALGGGDYALFLHARDSFASTGRVMLQLLGAALGAYVPGGHRFVYVSLVDLRSGDIVWFNVLSSMRGDIRDAEGARATIASIMDDMPTRPDMMEAAR